MRVELKLKNADEVSILIERTEKLLMGNGQD